MKSQLSAILKATPEKTATWRYHLVTSLIVYLGIVSFGWKLGYFWRLAFIIQRYPLHLIMNLIMAVAISYLLSLLIRKKLWHFGVFNFIAIFFASVSGEKFETLGLPLYAIDLSLTKYSDVFLEYFTINKLLYLVWGFALPWVLITIPRRKKPSLLQSMRATPRLQLLEWRSLSAAIFGVQMGCFLFFVGVFKIFGMILDVRPQEPFNDYIGNGDLVSFTLSFYTGRNHIKHYSIRPELLAALRHQDSAHPLNLSCQTKERPDVLVVMIESMFDPVQIPQMQFSEDPLAPLRNMGYTENRSYLFVPAYGGQTANTEFEFLTGSTHRFFPLGTVQYQHHLYFPANSIVRMLSAWDYRSIAVHNYSRHLWRRDEVYPLLGFEKYYGLEDIQAAIPVENYDGHTKPQDKALARFVPDQMKQNINRPGFYFVVTMGTHGPYHKYLLQTKNQLKLTTRAQISDNSVSMLQNYANFLSDSSQALSDLFRYALGRSKPTVVVFFGDHLPGLPDETYKNTGYSDWMKRETGISANELKVVPVRVLNNFGCKLEVPPVIASNCLGSHLMAQLQTGFPTDNFWKFNYEFCKKHPMIFDGIDPSNLKGDLADYAGMIYQNLFRWTQNAR